MIEENAVALGRLIGQTDEYKALRRAHEQIKDLPHLQEGGAEGIGLYRTEVPFMIRDSFPDVPTQTELLPLLLKYDVSLVIGGLVYRRACPAAGPAARRSDQASRPRGRDARRRLPLARGSAPRAWRGYSRRARSRFSG